MNNDDPKRNRDLNLSISNKKKILPNRKKTELITALGFPSSAWLLPIKGTNSGARSKSNIKIIFSVMNCFLCNLELNKENRNIKAYRRISCGNVHNDPFSAWY